MQPKPRAETVRLPSWRFGMGLIFGLGIGKNSKGVLTTATLYPAASGRISRIIRHELMKISNGPDPHRNQP
jgi:hypothetical protein